jgi:hypothetical protein
MRSIGELIFGAIFFLVFFVPPVLLAGLVTKSK